MTTTAATPGTMTIRVSQGAPGPKGEIAQQAVYHPGDKIGLDGNATLSIDDTFAFGQGPLTWQATLQTGATRQELKATPSDQAVGGGSRALMQASSFSIPYAALGASNNLLTLVAVDAANKPVYQEQFPVEKTMGSVLALTS